MFVFTFTSSPGSNRMDTPLLNKAFKCPYMDFPFHCFIIMSFGVTSMALWTSAVIVVEPMLICLAFFGCSGELSCHRFLHVSNTDGVFRACGGSLLV